MNVEKLIKYLGQYDKKMNVYVNAEHAKLLTSMNIGFHSSDNEFDAPEIICCMEADKALYEIAPESKPVLVLE